jgi:serine/threonine protein kinase
MAPELFTCFMYDPILADIWSLGVMYACMALGKFLWTVAQVQNAAFAAYFEADLKQLALILCPQIDTDYRNPPDLVRQFPASVQNLAHSMLRVQPAKRSGLASISRSICDIANRQNELSNRESPDTEVRRSTDA